MNETAQVAEANEAGKQKSSKREVNRVKMTDGREVDFGVKQKLSKDILKQDGSEWKPGDSDDDVYAVRFDYSNGETRLRVLDEYPISRRLKAHGISQKEGDEGAGTDDVEDIIFDLDSLSDRLKQGIWAEERRGGGAGVSLLAQAIVEVYKKPMDEVRKFLAELKPAEKDALKAPNSPLKPVLDRLQAEKAAKSPVDIAQLLAKVGLAPQQG